MRIRVEEKYKGTIITQLAHSDSDKDIIQELKKKEQLFDAVHNIYYDLEHYNFEKRFLKLIFEYEKEIMTINLYIDFVNRFVYFIDENENIIATSTLENGEYREFIHSYESCFKAVVDYKISKAEEYRIEFFDKSRKMVF